MVVMVRVVETTSSAATVISHVIPGDATVTGVASLGDDVFIVRYNSQQVEVYDAMTFTLQRRLSVPGLGRSFGLAACTTNRCLYASDFNNDVVHRMELSGRNAVTKWSVGREPAGLTVNSAKNVLVVSQGERTLQLFTTHGALVQTIQLQSDIEYPCQVVELSHGQLMISHARTNHRVCLLDVKGAAVGSYGERRGSDMTKMKYPAGLAVDKYDNILVADKDNDRLLVLVTRMLVLDRSLTIAREMSVTVDGGLKGPYSLWYDKLRGRLYIGEWTGRRVIIIDHLKDFTASQV